MKKKDTRKDCTGGVVDTGKHIPGGKYELNEGCILLINSTQVRVWRDKKDITTGDEVEFKTYLPGGKGECRCQQVQDTTALLPVRCLSSSSPTYPPYLCSLPSHPFCGPNIPRAPSQPFLNAPSMPSSLPPSPIHILTSYPLTYPFLMSAIPHSFIPFLAFHDTPKFIPHRKTSSRPSHIPFYLLLNSHLHTSAIYPHLVFSMKLAICHPTSPWTSAQASQM